MSGNENLPPQAYTREVLVKAYEWLSTQPEEVSDKAKSADKLVALYLQAKRRAQWEAPSAASVEAFKADLKNLAEGLKQFEDASTAPPTMPPHAPQLNPTPAPQPVMAPAHAPAVPPMSGKWTFPPQPEPKEPEPALVETLDAKSRAWVQDVQNRLNLSSEDDAMRALIAIGYERIKDLLPRT